MRGQFVAKLDHDGEVVWAHALSEDPRLFYRAEQAIDSRGVTVVLRQSLAELADEYNYDDLEALSLVAFDPRGAVLAEHSLGTAYSFSTSLGADESGAVLLAVTRPEPDDLYEPGPAVTRLRKLVLTPLE